MRPRIIAVDYDGTLYDGQPNERLISALKREQARGAIVILWTCREGAGLHEAVEVLSRCGFKPNCVNRNHPLGIRTLGHDSRKVYADVYIDDKNARLA